MPATGVRPLLAAVHRLRLLLPLILGCPFAASAQQPPSSLPLVQISDFDYQGAFRLPADQFGASDMNFSEGPLEYNPDRHSIFIVGHSHHQAIAEFQVPTLVKSTVLNELQMAGAPRQNFVTVLGKAQNGNPQGINRIGGLRYLPGANGPQLLINGYEYYDAPADNSHTTLVVRSPGAIAGSTIDGYFSLRGAAHASGWISPIPSEWRSIFGASYITGHSSGIPIHGRSSIGPTAFAFEPADIVDLSPLPNPLPQIATTTLLDFSLSHKLHDDMENNSGTNDLWTHLSRAVYGFIVPGTRSYVTLGHSGGHRSGVCYKCTQNNGNTCGGYCAPDAGDYYLYYWLWDLNQLAAVVQGQLTAYAPRPYAYGEFPAPFAATELGGGSYDPQSGTLFITLQRADRGQGQFANPPVIAAYRFTVGTDGGFNAPDNLRVTGSGY